MTDASIERFDRTTSRWGRATMLAGLVISLAGPLYLMFGEGYWPGWGPVTQAWVAVAVVFGVFWFSEPITYYPMLGSAASYQAFMIGNIANKLLPSALAAQSAIGARHGTKKAEIAAVTAIIGAAVVHLVSLLLLVGLLGTWLASLIPPSVTEVFGYIVPAILGPVLVQAVLSAGQNRTRVIALACGAAGVYLLVALVPSSSAYAMVVCVVLAVALSLLLRDRGGSATTADTAADEKSEASA
ncbi:hypothetical protein [Prauserella muralis]|uniref:Uncharacterized protein n=1 Tax=Prauserella muralis TaxID=588067 RepID=A0A2V4AQC0_9PSEU|nr:hypothetical protein [Prauserella muralis]PXY22559.1 hypothetical protein BAY60_22235 [Prauserella muralis]TWE28249.1 hypothetical protein FHX69_0901 [Prauserella muralis]